MSLYRSLVRLDSLQDSGETSYAPRMDHQAELQRSAFLERSGQDGPQSEWGRANRQFVEDFNALVDRGDLFYREESFF